MELESSLPRSQESNTELYLSQMNALHTHRSYFFQVYRCNKTSGDVTAGALHIEFYKKIIHSVRLGDH
jgi:hypothetical protein